ncbi:MAG: hypothetical protein LBM01_01565 [Christensenellaceae bacterium]|jgi:hypothetical protein|nr:hypothetical protein [Christensenellaceae bacterium]
MRKKEIVSRLAEEVQNEFEIRKLERRGLENQWRLNLDFYNGKQNRKINSFDKLADTNKQFYWQENEVFNHIAPLVEARLAKLGEVQIEKSELLEKSGFPKARENVSMWAELTGTGFYKVVWDNENGVVVGLDEDGREIKLGSAKVVSVSPFEIFADNLAAPSFNEVSSLIHAKVCDKKLIERTWGVKIGGLDTSAVVIERYKNGLLTIVCEGQVLVNEPYDYLPFVRQTSELVAGNFFGKSPVQRAIPVQRAYNSLKNRKSEFLARLACGVLAVEDGSVDLDELEQTGLAPGKIVSYRQGASAPKFLDAGSIPTELLQEEERLLNEFKLITGGADITVDSGKSGVALEILTNQDNRRMTRPIASLKEAAREVNEKINYLGAKYGKR